MKALLISGSQRKGGNTEIMLQGCAKELEAHDIGTEILSLSGKRIKGCTGCGWCRENQQEKRCVMQDDDFLPIFQKMLTADIIVVGSPVYFGSATPELMALLDRAGYVGRPISAFSRKLGGALTVARRAGQNFTLAQLMYWFLLNDMIVPGSTYWNIGFGAAKGDVEQDTESAKVITRFAENLAWLAHKIHTT
ncbi:MAG: flavodoxin family protein [Kiritimatiellae bacterium]|nr:flavodoxin family protein [Kiritimatiellia bacterium]MDD4735768.1 flavodoxin family protein [Kiritimatiellia bacterium]